MKVLKGVTAYELSDLEDIARTTNAPVSYDALDDLAIQDFDVIAENICTVRKASMYKCLGRLPDVDNWTVITCTDTRTYVISVSKKALYAILESE